MDNLPKENDAKDAGSQSGEIFQSQEQSAYEQATSLASETSQETGSQSEATQELGTPAQVEQSSQGATPIQDFPPGGPPPFVEDKKKKYLIFAVLAIFLLLFIILIFNFIRSRVSGKPAAANITLNYWGLWEDNEILQSVIDEYQKQHSNITITYVKQDPKLYRERLQAAIDRGEGPDIFRFHNSWTPMLKNQLALLPKDIYSDADFEKTFYPVAATDVKIGDNYHGIPLEIDGLLLFYNEDILKGANVNVPVSWVDVQNTIEKITVKENDRIVTSAIALGTAENIEHYSDIISLMMLQNGTQMAKSLFSCSDETSTTCGVEALTFYRNFAETPNNSWDETLENSILAFAGGKVAMIFAPSWQALTIKEINPNLNFKAAPAPQLPCDRQPCPSVHLASYWIEGVSGSSKTQQAAWEFVKYLSEGPTLQKLYEQQAKSRKLFGEPYSRVDLGKSLSDDPYLSALIAAAPTMKSAYSVSRTYDGETGLNTSLNNYLKDAVNSLASGVSPETALKTADNGFQQVFSRFGIASTAQPTATAQ